MSIKLGFVVSEFNRDLTIQMETLGKEHAAFLGATVEKIYYVPGVFDMPLAVKKMAQDKTIDAVVTIGCVIQGATKHDELVIQHASRKIADLALEFSKPITLGISGPGMSRLDAHERVEYGINTYESSKL
jgi:6,7-dimethyl-8-ribityllumazine synthase